jgi:hypothetical protein
MFAAVLRAKVLGDLGELEAHLDEVLEKLEGLEAVDPDYAASLVRGEIEFTGFVEAEGPGDASQKFAVLVRTAIHAAQGGTPGWPSFNDTSAQASTTDTDWLVDA